MPEEAMLSETAMAYQTMDGGSQHQNINPADFEGLLVRFVLYPFQNKARSKEEGRPIYEEIPFVDIRTPGDRTSHQFRPAANIDRARWPKHWAAFESRQKGGEDAVEGTPLENWPPISRSLVEELKYFHVTTVEQLADLNDAATQNFMGINTWKQRAKVFLELSKDAAAADQLASELASRDVEIEALKDAVAALTAKIEESVEVAEEA